jgi:DNA polymerase-1
MSANRPRKRLFLLDGTALVYRAYFAFIRNPLVNSRGVNTSGAFGFTHTLLKILRDESPDYLGCAFDTPAPTFRHRDFPAYKATREKMPDELRAELPVIKNIVRAFRIPLLEAEGFEADDLMGALAKRAEAAGLDVFLVTGDKDMMQVVSQSVRLYTLSKGGAGAEAEIVGPAEVEAKWGVPPGGITDLLGLMGDASDNVPGVPGIGPKTARELVLEFGSMEALYAGLGRVKRETLRAKLEANRDQALLSKRLVTLRLDAPVPESFEDLALQGPDRVQASALFEDLEFHRFLRELPGLSTPGAASGTGTPAGGRACRIVRTEAELRGLADTLSRQERISVDLETTSLFPMEADLVGLSFAWKEGEAVYVPVRPPENRPGADLFAPAEGSAAEAVLAPLRPVLEDPSVRKYGQNIKYDLLVLRRHGVRLASVDFDTMVAAYLINPGARQFGIDALAMEYLNLHKIPTKSLIGSGAKQISMADVPVEKVAEYACEDAETALRLRAVFEPKLAEAGVDALFRDVEVPLIGVLADMEENGVSLDTGLLSRLSADMQKELAGEAFNLNSTQQLGKILFDKLKVHEAAGWKRPRRTKTGYSTDVGVLEALAPHHPLPAKLLEYRQLAKLKSTYVDALPRLVNPRTGRVHASFNQAVAATGRLSSSDPNLQNIPVRTDLGREIRKAFVPRDPSGIILSADYNQIELRLMAHLSGDETLLESFRRGEDVHQRTAAEVFGVSAAEVTPDLRRRAKTINFGILYGMGPYGLADRLGIPFDEAQGIITAYFSRYPGVNAAIAATIAEAHRNGFVTTLLNRRRYLPELKSENRSVREFAERTAVNTPIQGTAADLIKLAMIRVSDRLRREAPDVKLILQIHDELVFETPASGTKVLTRLVTEEMENVLELSVPIRVDVGSGKNWYEAH